MHRKQLLVCFLLILIFGNNLSFGESDPTVEPDSSTTTMECDSELRPTYNQPCYCDTADQYTIKRTTKVTKLKFRDADFDNISSDSFENLTTLAYIDISILYSAIPENLCKK